MFKHLFKIYWALSELSAMFSELRGDDNDDDDVFTGSGTGSIGKYQKLAIRQEHIKNKALKPFQDNINLF